MGQILIDQFDRKTGKFICVCYLEEAAQLIRYAAPFHTLEFIRETLLNGDEILTPYSIFRKQDIPVMKPVMIKCFLRPCGPETIYPLDSTLEARIRTEKPELSRSEIRDNLYNGQIIETNSYIFQRKNTNMIDWTKPIETANGNLVKLISTNSGVKGYPNIVMLNDDIFLIDMNGRVKGSKPDLRPWLRNVEEKLTGAMYLNIYDNYKSAYYSRADADEAASNNRLACIKVDYTGKIGQFDG